MPEVKVTRVPQPVAARHAVPENDRLSDPQSRGRAPADRRRRHDRPEVAAGFCRRMSTSCATRSRTSISIAKSKPIPRRSAFEMPKPIFKSKIWTPWADANQPFFYEDAAFMGRKDDVRKLTLPVSSAPTRTCWSVEPCYHYYHIVRFAKAFLPAYPMFKGYLENYHHITNNMPYRMEMMPPRREESRLLPFPLDRACLDSSQPLPRRYGRAGRPSVLSQHAEQGRLTGRIPPRGISRSRTRRSESGA